MMLIIGGGIAGLTTALAFEKLNIPYQVFERAPALGEVGAGIWLAPNALQVFEWLGILGEVQQNGNEIDRITVATNQIEPISDNPQAPIKKVYGYTTVAIHRANLLDVLYQHLPKEKVHFDRPFKRFERLDNQEIKAYFSNDTSATGSHIIAADGINSKVRQQLFPNSKIRYTGQTCWRGIANFTLPLEFQHRGIECWGKEIRFGISKVATNQVYWFAVAKSLPNQHDNREHLQEKLLNTYQNFHPLVQGLIKNTPTDKVSRNDINDLKPIPHWFQDNICLIGDAGHATTPNMGQGGAQAIEDAYYLANIINESGIGKAFALFQKTRQKKVNTIVSTSWSTGKIAHLKYGKRLRNFFLSNMPNSIMLKQMLELYTIDKKYF